MLPETAREALRHVAARGGDIDAVTDGLRATWPEHFHSDASLAERRFHHRPVDSQTGAWRDIPMAGFASEQRVAEA